MSTTTAKGYKIPESGDRGTWFGDIEYNFERLNSHKHDGLDSESLNSKAIQKLSVAVSAGDWADQGGGTYKQFVDAPNGLLIANANITVQSSGGVIFPTIEIVNPTRIAIYVNDPSLNLTVYF
jgi:hypothetical protein